MTAKIKRQRKTTLDDFQTLQKPRSPLGEKKVELGKVLGGPIAAQTKKLAIKWHIHGAHIYGIAKPFGNCYTKTC
jgi:hypothetical protein